MLQDRLFEAALKLYSILLVKLFLFRESVKIIFDLAFESFWIMYPMSGNNFLELGKNPVRFDPVGAVTNVFFDESNTQVSECLFFGDY